MWCRNLYNYKIHQAKVETETKNANELREVKNLSPKRWWRLAKTYINNDSGQSSRYPQLDLDNKLISDDTAKAEAFNTFFLDQTKVDDSFTTIPDKIPHVNHSLATIVISEQNVSDLLKCIDDKKATGPELISQAMLKMAGNSIVPSLTKLFKAPLRDKLSSSMHIANLKYERGD